MPVILLLYIEFGFWVGSIITRIVMFFRGYGRMIPNHVHTIRRRYRSEVRNHGKTLKSRLVYSPVIWAYAVLGAIIRCI